MRNLTVFAFALLGALPAAGQSLTIGPGILSGTPTIGAGPGTAIDLSAPASAAGTVTRVRFQWSGSPCPVKFKFFRRTGNTLTLIAERGPYNSGFHLVTEVTLEPPVEVQRGDLIGAFDPAGCGVASAFPVAGASFLDISGEVTGTYTYSDAEIHPGAHLSLQGLGEAVPGSSEALQGIVPVVASTPGAMGSYFRTSLQLAHPGASFGGTLSGRIVYHRAGAEGSLDDPSIPYSLAPNQVVSYPDLLAAFGVSGAGTIDFFVPQDLPLPVVNVRVYNDAGPAGTSGLVEPVVDNGAMMIDDGRDGYLITPVDPSRTRLNIGTRTVEAAIVTYVLHDASGVPVASTTRTYPSLYFEQVSADALFGAPVGASQLIRVQSNGGVIVYGAATDNITNDPAMSYATIRAAF